MDVLYLESIQELTLEISFSGNRLASALEEVPEVTNGPTATSTVSSDDDSEKSGSSFRLQAPLSLKIIEVRSCIRRVISLAEHPSRTVFVRMSTRLRRNSTKTWLACLKKRDAGMNLIQSHMGTYSSFRYVVSRPHLELATQNQSLEAIPSFDIK